MEWVWGEDEAADYAEEGSPEEMEHEEQFDVPIIESEPTNNNQQAP